MYKIESMFGIQWTDINQALVGIGTKLLISIAILVIGWWLSKKVNKAIKAVMEKSSLDAGLTSFLSSIASTVLKILVVLTAAGQLGIQMTSFIALIGAAGLAVGMAFSGTLSNLAGGVMILFFKPFKVDDFINAQGELGTVKEIHIFHTIMLTTDNRTVIIPNGPLANGNIVNFTNQGSRRVDLVFGFNYGGDFDKVKAVIKNVVENHPKILKEPAPFIALGSLGDSSVNVTVRPWVLSADYWDVHFDMNEIIYKEFAKHNIGIPLPQMDVHIKNQN
jgi:small conductance mechanosensitive channel